MRESKKRQNEMHPLSSLKKNQEGLALNYYISTNAQNTIGLRMSYLFEKRGWNPAYPIPADKFISIKLVKRHKISHRKNSRFFYEYGFAMAHKTVQHPIYGLPYIGFCGTGLAKEDCILISLETPTYQMLMGGNVGVQYDFRIGKHLFLGANIEAALYYDFYEEAGYPVIQPALNLSYVW